MKGKLRFVALLAAAVAAAAWSKRPVKPPESTGAWAPADAKRSTR